MTTVFRNLWPAICRAVGRPARRALPDRDCPRFIAESAWWLADCSQCGRRFDSEREGATASGLPFCGPCFFSQTNPGTEPLHEHRN